MHCGAAVGPPLFEEDDDLAEPLHHEVLHFAQRMRPSPLRLCLVEAVIGCVRNAIKAQWPEGDVEVFGSFATGLCTYHSDVDLAVVDVPCTDVQASTWLKQDLSDYLQQYEWCVSVEAFTYASMPILKCLCRPSVRLPNSLETSSATIAVDISIGGMRHSESNQNYDATQQEDQASEFITSHLGAASRDYVLHKIQELPALAPLVLVLKSLLIHTEGLNSVYHGGLGSFTLTLLVIFHLEQTLETTDPGSILLDESSDTPSSNSGYVRRASQTLARVLSFWYLDGPPQLGTFLLGFLRRYGHDTNLSTCGKMVLKGIKGDPGGFFEHNNAAGDVVFWIDHPLRPGINVGAGSYEILSVQLALEDMRRVLTGGRNGTVQLRQDDIDCPELAVMSELPHISGCLSLYSGLENTSDKTV